MKAMRRRHRVLVGLFIALCGIAIAVGADLTWIGVVHGRPKTGIDHTSLNGLLHWSYQYTGSFVKSFAIAVVIAGVLVVVGGLFGWRVPAGLFSLIALVAAGLWLALYTSHYSSTSLAFSDLGLGAILTIAGSVLGLISTPFLRRRRA
jgi:hypothetical protein